MKLLYKIGVLLGILKAPMEDPQKVAKKIVDLNNASWRESGSPPMARAPQVWQEFTGYNALTKFDFNNGAPIFHPSVGIPLKAFLNIVTGEVKLFVASIFER